VAAFQLRHAPDVIPFRVALDNHVEITFHRTKV
jgi:hypothetical protein